MEILSNTFCKILKATIFLQYFKDENCFLEIMELMQQVTALTAEDPSLDPSTHAIRPHKPLQL